MTKRNIIKEMQKGLIKTTFTKKAVDNTNSEAKNGHITEASTISFYVYDYSNKTNDPIEDQSEFGPFESLEDNFGIFSFTTNGLYALSNNSQENLFVNSEEYDPFVKVAIFDGDVIKIADYRYVISDQRLLSHQSAKKSMGQLLVKKSTFGTQKLIEEREKNIQSFENKIQERQNIVRDLQAKVIKMSSNKNKASDLKLQIKRWIQDIEEAKRTVIFLDKENLQLSEINYEDRISDQKKELKRLEEEKFKLIEKSNLSKERLIKIQEADDRKKMILNNKISDIEKEEQKLEAKLNELKNKKNVLKD